MHLATWETEAGGSLKFRRLRSSIKWGGGAGDVTRVVECLPFVQEVWVQSQHCVTEVWWRPLAIPAHKRWRQEYQKRTNSWKLSSDFHTHQQWYTSAHIAHTITVKKIKRNGFLLPINILDTCYVQSSRFCEEGARQHPWLPRTHSPEEREKEIIHHPQLHSEFKANRGNTRPCLKIVCVCVFLSIKIQNQNKLNNCM